MKARYDVQNLGHFGLAAKYYCHFTSPSGAIPT
ncbi:MAG: RNB domain-containing ribonuclease [Intestinimonas sp.]